MKKLLLACFLFLSAPAAFAQCVAGFSALPDTNDPFTVTLIDISTSTGTITSYMIDYGDSMVGTIPNSTHTYPAAGVFTVYYQIADMNGCTDSTFQVIQIPTTSGVHITYFDDSVFTACTAPLDVPFIIAGLVTGATAGDSVVCELHFGDGLDSTFTLQTDVQGYFNAYPMHTYLNPGNYNPSLIVSDIQNPADADTGYANPIFISSTCGPITGMVYIDNNGDCIYNAGDSIGAGIYLQIVNAGQLAGYTVTDSLGNYSFNQPTGTNYDIVVQPANTYYNHYTISCPASGMISAGSPSSGNDFGLSCANGYDLTGTVSAWGIRPGLTAYVYVSAYNNRCITPTGQIEVTLDPLVTPMPDPSYTINGQVVTYTILPGEYSWQFAIPVTVPTTATIGDTVCISLAIMPVAGDSVPLNNYGTFCFPVVNSCDPNEKHVEPVGEGPLGLITPSQDLTYTIMFQNTGTADAINIYILDTLSSYLHPESIHVIGASHPMTWLWLPGNILRFSFDNIYLPDSNSNEPLSHGFVTYSIRQNLSNPQAAPINNTAGIYFDYNPPVITNTTLNTVDYFLGTKIISCPYFFASVYPSPADKFLAINFDAKGQRDIAVYSFDGKEVFKTNSVESMVTISVENLSSGIYYLKINNEMQTEKIVIVH
jgi:uncharacterized repeat protein (TIGR01451 family)